MEMSCRAIARRAMFLAAGLAAALSATCANAATLRAEYLFANTLTSSIGGAPTLASVDPLGQNHFLSESVFGQSRQVFETSSNGSSIAAQAGLRLDTTGLVTTNDYSLQMVVKVIGGNTAYKRLIQSGSTDNGLYINDSGNTSIYANANNPGGSFSLGDWHDLVLVVSGGSAQVWLDGSLDLTLATSVMNITAPGDVLSLYIDDQLEFTNARTAAVRLWNGALTATEISALDAQGLPSQVPEPTPLALLALGLGLAGWARRKPTVKKIYTPS